MYSINKKSILVSLLAIVISLGSCGKYEDGPAFSLLSKTQRLTGEWEVKEWKEDGEELIGQGLEMDLEFEDNGDFSLDLSIPLGYDYYYGLQDLELTLKGDWEFSSDKSEIEMSFDAVDGLTLFDTWDIEITRLTNKELQGEVTFASPDVYGYTTSSSTAKFEAEKN